jgi:hypothetical protein
MLLWMAKPLPPSSQVWTCYRFYEGRCETLGVFKDSYKAHLPSNLHAAMPEYTEGENVADVCRTLLQQLAAMDEIGERVKSDVRMLLAAVAKVSQVRGLEGSIFSSPSRSFFLPACFSRAAGGRGQPGLR